MTTPEKRAEHRQRRLFCQQKGKDEVCTLDEPEALAVLET